jgi:hypothetical protein
MHTSKFVFSSCCTIIASLFILPAQADHAWGKYHWDLSTAQTETDPLELGDNTTSGEWGLSLDRAWFDWNASVLKNTTEIGLSAANCDPTAGRVEVCHDEYGDNGWLGIASILITRGRDGHITQAVVKLNEPYFNLPGYDTDAWRTFVMCQEAGHTFGLGHQDENFSNDNLGSCMDYTNDPSGTVYGQLNNEHPNQHDFDELEAIYAHLNSTGSGDGGGNGNKGGGRKPDKSEEPGQDYAPHHPDEWGQAVRQDAQGRNNLYYRQLADGRVIITHVLWAIEQ